MKVMPSTRLIATGLVTALIGASALAIWAQSSAGERAAHTRWGAPKVKGVKGLANYVFVARNRGGKPLVIRVTGRPLTPADKETIGPSYTDVQVSDPALTTVEAAVRETGFAAMDANSRSKTIWATIDGSWKSVRSHRSAGFRKAWRPIQDASVSVGSSRNEVR
jgi:hypothetical protein